MVELQDLILTDSSLKVRPEGHNKQKSIELKNLRSFHQLPLRSSKDKIDVPFDVENRKTITLLGTEIQAKLLKIIFEKNFRRREL